MASRRKSLLEVLQALIERTYLLEHSVADLHQYVVGDEGYRALYERSRIVTVVESGRYSAAQLMVRQQSDIVRARIYYPDALIAELERRDPMCGLDAGNIDPFAVFVEELDHFLTLADRAREGRGISMFELETHANVTKYLTCRYFLERSVKRPLHRGELRWLRFRLFENLSPPVDSPALHARYRDADRLAARYTLYLDSMPGAERLPEIRRFHRLSKCRMVRHLSGTTTLVAAA